MSSVWILRPQNPGPGLAVIEMFDQTRQGGSCSALVNNAVTIHAITSQLAWTNAIHGPEGHLLLNDGSVIFTDTPTLRTTLFINKDSGVGQFHFLAPR